MLKNKKIEVIKDFPMSNVCDVEIEEKRISVLSFAPSPKGGPECLWFYFKVKTSGIKKIKLILKYSYNMLGGGKPENFRPVIKFGEKEWQRISEGNIIENEDGRKSVLWEVDILDEIFEIAFCYPYGKKELDELINESKNYWKRDVIGVSQEEREIIRLSNFYRDIKKYGIYLIARQHSGETPGSWVLDGFLRYLSEIKYKNLIVWAVPFSNIDGIENGYYGKDNFPYDLNRAWGYPPMRHEILVIQRDIMRWKERCIPFLSIDFHAPGASETDGAYFFITSAEKDEKQHKIEKEIAEKLGKKIGKYMAKNYIRFINYKSRWETPHFTDFIRENIKIPSLTIEIPYSICGNTLMKKEDYRKIGKKMALCIIEEIEKRK